MIDIYADDEVVDRMTEAMLDKGMRIFQMWKAGETDEEHCRWLLELAQFPRGAQVLDAGCGVGEVARVMKSLRADLQFNLLNISGSQLARAPQDMPKYEADLNTMAGVPSHAFDAVMVCYALGHVELAPFMQAVARVLKPGGKLFIYDTWSSDPDWVMAYLNRRAYVPWQVVIAAELAGLDGRKIGMNTYDLSLDTFRKVCGDEDARLVQRKMCPVAYVFWKDE